MVERPAVNRQVVGSSPTRGASRAAAICRGPVRLRIGVGTPPTASRKIHAGIREVWRPTPSRAEFSSLPRSRRPHRETRPLAPLGTPNSRLRRESGRLGLQVGCGKARIPRSFRILDRRLDSSTYRSRRGIAQRLRRSIPRRSQRPSGESVFSGSQLLPFSTKDTGERRPHGWWSAARRPSRSPQSTTNRSNRLSQHGSKESGTVVWTS